MMYIDTKKLKSATYRTFISQHLKKAQYIIVSIIDDIPPFAFASESVKIPEGINFHSINFSENERLYCFRNNYYDIYTTLNSYNSMEDFFNVTNVYRLMFILSNEVVVECMCDEVIVYSI